MTAVAGHLRRAASLLASYDMDRAQESNGVGFSQSDTTFGHQLASTPAEAWTADTTASAYVMLRHYRRQLSEYGIVWDDIVVPAGVAKDGSTLAPRGLYAIDSHDDMFLFRFPYSPTLIEQVRDMPGRLWDRGSLCWTVPASSVGNVRAFAEAHGFGWTDSATALAAEDREALPNGSVTLHTDLLRITFDYDPARVSDVKRIRGRRFDSRTKCWTVPVEMVREVREFADTHGLAVGESVDALEDVEPHIAPAVEVASGAFAIRFPFDRDLGDRVRSLPGATWVKSLKAWSVPLEASVEVIDFVVETGALIGDSVGDLLDGARAALLRAERSNAYTSDFDVPGLGLTLRTFQRAAVEYATEQRRCLIADEMGLGKTITSIAAIEHDGAYPAVVVVPEGLRLNWERELRRMVPNRTVQICYGNTPGMLHADVVIIGYGVLTAWLPWLVSYGVKGVVLDESHKIKTHTTARTKAALSLCEFVRDGDGSVYLLSGTPLPNRLIELRTQLSALGVLDDFGGWKDFSKLWRGRLVELHRRMRASCYMRRLKSEVLTELPPKQWVSFPVEPNAAAMVRYRKAEDDILNHLAEQARAAATASGATSEEAQRAAWMRVQRASRAQHLVMLGELMRLSAEAKADGVAEFVKRFTDEGRKLVVFGTSRSIVGGVAKDHANGCVVWGGQTPQARQAAVDRFQDEDEQTVISVSIAAGGVGLTLTAASDVVFIEQAWTPAEMDQGADRCHRMGQRDSVTAYVLTIPDTVDDDISDLLAEKRVEIDGVVDGVLDQTDDSSSVVSDLLVRLTERGLAA